MDFETEFKPRYAAWQAEMLAEFPHEDGLPQALNSVNAQTLQSFIGARRALEQDGAWYDNVISAIDADDVLGLRERAHVARRRALLYKEGMVLTEAYIANHPSRGVRETRTEYVYREIPEEWAAALRAEFPDDAELHQWLREKKFMQLQHFIHGPHLHAVDLSWGWETVVLEHLKEGKFEELRQLAETTQRRKALHAEGLRLENLWRQTRKVDVGPAQWPAFERFDRVIDKDW